MDNPPQPHSQPLALTIAGSDSCSGAGIQADLKTFAALGVYGLNAVTCVVAETTQTVESIDPVEPAVVCSQIRLLTSSYPVAAAKTGMLYSSVHVASVCDSLPEAIPLVVDPVMVSTSGTPLLLEDAVQRYKESLFPLATVITPNLDEASFLLGEPITTRNQLEPAAKKLADSYSTAVLLKGGHLGAPEATDVLVTDTGTKIYTAPFIPGVSTHGTGCTYSAAITAHLASGLSLADAVSRAKQFVTNAITNHLRWGSIDALHHFTKS
ncbi:MAG: bifunctional hydroxymethylpyrimidine kinase/phosphomethylpyrimidine kinase [Verrucomicrobiales bacterium]|nr:bifunctional hydroxymethylpyrimidine kinase/phosphomethylpyrimidine kinase [Verrucomicrobiales bacterium]